jgi:hypothetical protein
MANERTQQYSKAKLRDIEHLKDDPTAKVNAAIARANAATAQAIVTWTQKSERLCQKHKVLKRQFVDHCKDHLECEKLDHKARLRSHRA